MVLQMDKNELLVGKIKEQISLAGVQVKQRMQKIQLELLEELNNENGNGVDLH